MSFARKTFLGGCALLVAACGGSSFSGGGDDAQSGAAGAGANQGGGSGGKSGAGGSTSPGGKASAGTTGVAGGPNCAAVDCAEPVCPNGAQPVKAPGECCAVCPATPSGCEGVICAPIVACAEGYERGPADACCEGCVPQPGGAACREIACPPDQTCPLGYVRGDLVGGCCYECLPDPLFCNVASDCRIANRPRTCCGCPEAISQRTYQADSCWFDIEQPRMIPQSCYPQATCDAVCNACPPPGMAACVQNRCTATGPR